MHRALRVSADEREAYLKQRKSTLAAAGADAAEDWTMQSVRRRYYGLR
jgi:hypothetical protein